MEYAVDIVFHSLQYLAIIVFFDAFVLRKYQADSFWWRVAVFGAAFHVLSQVNNDFFKYFQALAMVLLLYVVLWVLYKGDPLYHLFYHFFCTNVLLNRFFSATLRQSNNAGIYPNFVCAVVCFFCQFIS